MSRSLQGRAPFPENPRQSEPRRSRTALALIGSGFIICVIIASLFFRHNTGSPKDEAMGAATAPTQSRSATATPPATPASPNNPAASLMVPAVVMETSFPTLDGRQQRLADFKGKVLVIDVWATWCGPCRLEIPHLVDLAREYKGRGVEVIGFTTENPVKDAEKVRGFVREFKINYPIAWANREFALHLQQGRDVIPQTYVIGRNGRVFRHLVGYNAQKGPSLLRAAIEEALGAG